MKNKPVETSPDKTPIPAIGTQRDVELAAVLQKLISKLQESEDRRYSVGLAGYYIDGIPYCASGLTVDLAATPQIEITNEGFACIAFFAPDLLWPSTVRKQGTIKMQFGGPPVDVVRVRVEVRYRDIFVVAEFVHGKQHNLFVDPHMVARLAAFRREEQAWRRTAGQ